MSWRTHVRVAAACLAVVATGCSAPAPGQGAEPAPGQGAAPAPAPGPVPTNTPPRELTPATTRYVSPPALTPKNGDGSAAQPWNDFCYALGRVRTGDVLVVAGSHQTPYDMDTASTTSLTFECRITPSATDVTVWGATDPLIKGALIVHGTVRWTFDNIDATRSTHTGHQELVAMVGGSGWRWTNCEIWGAQAFANFSVGHWGGLTPPTDFRIDHCFIHDNPGWAAGGHTRDQDHDMYVFTVNGVMANGVIEDNVIVGAPNGMNVKIGGTGNGASEGSDGITFRRNVLANNRGIDGANLIVCTNSDSVTVENNLFVSQAPAPTAVNVKLGGFSGSDLVLSDNLFWGFDPNATHPRPIMWSSGTGVYDLIDLNQTSVHLAQARSIRSDPGYGPLSTANVRASFPSVARGGVTYGPTS